MALRKKIKVDAMNIKKRLSKEFFETTLQKIKKDVMKKIKKWLSKEFLKPALAMLRFVVENANPNLVFIGLVILGIFCLGFDWYFKYEQLKSEERIEIRKLELDAAIKIRKLELDAEVKIRKLELDAETQQFKRQKPKKKKGLVVEDTNPNLVFIGFVMFGIFSMGFYWHFCKQLKFKRQKPKKKGK